MYDFFDLTSEGFHVALRPRRRDDLLGTGEVWRQGHGFYYWKNDGKCSGVGEVTARYSGYRLRLSTATAESDYVSDMSVHCHSSERNRS